MLQKFDLAVVNFYIYLKPSFQV